MVFEKLNNSHIKVHCEWDDALTLKEYFSFHADNYKFNPKYKAGFWDGKIRLFDVRNQQLPIGLLYKLIQFCKSHNMDYVVDDELRPKRHDEINPGWIEEYVNGLGAPVQVRPYQVNALNLAMRYNKCGIVLPTGSGKSFVLYSLIRMIEKFNPSFKFLVVVPTVALVNQMHYDLTDYARQQDPKFGDKIHLIYSGRDKNSTAPITVSTWQSLQELPKEYFKQFNAVFVDEFHSATAKELGSITEACTEATYKIGMSGTLHESKVNNLMLEGLFGPLHKIIDTKTLIKEGYLSQLKIYNYILQYPKEDVKEYKRQIKALPPERPEKLYHTENNFIKDHRGRLKVLMKLISKVEGNTLILFKNVDYGQRIFEMTQKLFPNRTCFYVAGSVSPAERERIRLSVEEHKDCIIVASSQIFSTGINICKLHYLLFAQPSKSKIRILQSIGRILRKHESKQTAILIDVVDSITKNNFSLKHAIKRVEFYEREGFEYLNKEIQL